MHLFKLQLIILHKHTGVLTAHRGKQSNQAQRTQTLSIFIHSFVGWKKKKKKKAAPELSWNRYTFQLHCVPEDNRSSQKCLNDHHTSSLKHLAWDPANVPGYRTNKRLDGQAHVADDRATQNRGKHHNRPTWRQAVINSTHTIRWGKTRAQETTNGAYAHESQAMPKHCT